jgi:NAD(P)-dependent dehydrogenase (short-subunit alcohol dehydrogenase family)
MRWQVWSLQAEPEEVAAVCVMLASDEATYMTGTEISIDGGLLAGSAAAPKS